MGGATACILYPHAVRGYFNPRSPWGERRLDLTVIGIPSSISIHAPRGGSDRRWQRLQANRTNFNPRSPWGERPATAHHRRRQTGFQSTLPVGGATTLFRIPILRLSISIHAPRGGSDAEVHGPARQVPDFNPRSPWGERRGDPADVRRHGIFQSTLPVGGATRKAGKTGAGCGHFNPRSPWGERPQRLSAAGSPFPFQSTLPVGGATKWVLKRLCAQYISIHAPRGGSDFWRHSRSCRSGRFQSTLPVGGATSGYVTELLIPPISIHAPRGGSDCIGRLYQQGRVISIHAPRGGSDYFYVCPLIVAYNFNPRSPWGERRFFLFLTYHGIIFQSTLPVGGATFAKSPPYPSLGISIHAPRGGSDHNRRCQLVQYNHFNPRSPWGERRLQLNPSPVIRTFQSTLPVGGATARQK